MNKLYYWSDYYKRYFIVIQIVVGYGNYFKIIKPPNYENLRFKNNIFQIFSRTKRRFMKIDEFTVSYKTPNGVLVNYVNKKCEFNKIRISRNYLPAIKN